MNDLQPDVIILHTGLNDLRVSHVNDLVTDYSNFHEPHLIGSMGLCYLEDLPKVATMYYMVRLLQYAHYYPVCDFHSAQAHGQQSVNVDTYAISLYSAHLDKLVHILKFYTDKVILVPQVINADLVSKGELSWWIPFVPGEELAKHLNAFNDSTRHIAEKNGLLYVEEATERTWPVSEFADPSHLNAAGNENLASLIYPKLTLKQE